MNSFFKVDVERVKIPFLSKIPFTTSYFSHSLITDIHRKQFSQRVSPIALISDDSFSKPLLYINYVNPALKNKYTNCVLEKTGPSTYLLKNEDVDLQLTSRKAPLLEGGRGLVNLHGKKAYYYSLTNLVTEGKIKSGDAWIAVTGTSWLDHQWADTSYAKDRWDWFSVQLAGDTELVCCMYDNGVAKTYFADLSNPDGSQEHYKKVEIIPLEKQWIGPKTKAVYPLAWKIKIPAAHIELDLVAQNEDQEMLFGSINYWEGPLVVSGTRMGQKVAGVGFAELVGYPSKYSGLSYIDEEMHKLIHTFLSVVKDEAASLFASLKDGVFGRK